VAVLSRQIDGLQGRLHEPMSVAPAQGSRLQDTKDRLASLCARLKNMVDTLAAELSDQSPAENQWEQWADLSWQFRGLAADCLALEQSVTVRRDPGAALLCTAADKLAEGFSGAVGKPRSHYVLISEAEHFGVDASAIHLAYGRLEIWNLNRVAHEFGHLWGQECANGPGGSQKSFVEYLTKASRVENAINGKVTAPSPSPAWNEAQAKEFFADVLATFLMGPAYALACLTLDLSPADDRQSDSHPSGHERACCILMALLRLAPNYCSYYQDDMEKLHQELADFWSATRVAAGKPVTLNHQAELEYAVGIAVSHLLQEIPAAQHKCLEAAYTVRNELARNHERLPGGAQGLDVLNGAWIRRWEGGPAAPSPIGRAAFAMLEDWCK